MRKVLAAQQHWILETGETLRLSGNEYSVISPAAWDEGRFAVISVAGTPVIEFRSKYKTPFFDKTYRIAGNGTVLTVEPVTVSPVKIVPSGKPALRMEAVTQ
jgi:hypothetical protein